MKKDLKLEESIYLKSKERLDKENQERKTYCDYTGQKFQPVCKYYILTSGDKEINLDSLEPMDIMVFCLNHKNTNILKYCSKKQNIQSFSQLKELYSLKPYLNDYDIIKLYFDVLTQLGEEKMIEKALKHFDNLNIANKYSLNELIDELANKEKIEETERE